METVLRVVRHRRRRGRLRGRDPAPPGRAPACARLRSAGADRNAHHGGASPRARLRRSRIHEAARIGGVAGADEILVSTATLEFAGKAYRSETRTVTLKDIAEPVEVASIDWR